VYLEHRLKPARGLLTIAAADVNLGKEHLRLGEVRGVESHGLTQMLFRQLKLTEECVRHAEL
jgi:hypothetical protein